jgi:hypothetical protein
MGCALGAKAIPPHWSAPLHDTIRTEMCGLHMLKVSDMGRRMLVVAQKNVRRTQAGAWVPPQQRFQG